MAVVNVTLYQNAFQEYMEGAEALSLGNRSRFKMPVNAPGKMLASGELTSGSDWARVTDPFPENDKSNFSGGIAIVTVTGGEGDVDLYVGRPPGDNETPQFYDIMFQRTQRAFGLRKGDIVMVRDRA